MKQILRLFAVVSVILLATLITAFSCGGDDKANNNSGGSGGNGGGGGGTASLDCSGTLDTTFAVTSLVGSAVTVDTKTDGCIHVEMKRGAFNSYNQSDTNIGIMALLRGDSELRLRRFLKIEYTGATGGLVVVADGSADPKSLTIPITSDTPGGAVRKGIHIDTVSVVGLHPDKVPPRYQDLSNAALQHSMRKQGLNIYSVFFDPASYFPNVGNLHPKIFCHTHIAGIQNIPTRPDTTDFVDGTITQLMNQTLAGGEEADCVSASASHPQPDGGTTNVTVDYYLLDGTPMRGKRDVPTVTWKQFADGGDLKAWVTGAGDKNKLELRIVGLNTGNKTLRELIPGASPVATPDVATDRTALIGLKGGLTPAKLTGVKDDIKSVGLTIKIVE